jgi:hypothetical protein
MAQVGRRISGLHLGEKLNTVKLTLKEWAKHTYTPPEIEKAHLKSQLESLQERMEEEVISSKHQKAERMIFQNLHKVLISEEEMSWLNHAVCG